MKRKRKKPVGFNLLGPAREGHQVGRGGILPSYRPFYTKRQAELLHKLASSNPTPEEYQREKERILAT